jgi:hypothetical protein
VGKRRAKSARENSGKFYSVPVRENTDMKTIVNVCGTRSSFLVKEKVYWLALDRESIHISMFINKVVQIQCA